MRHLVADLLTVTIREEIPFSTVTGVCCLASTTGVYVFGVSLFTAAPAASDLDGFSATYEAAS